MVLDTNVIVSAMISPNSLPGEILRGWLAGKYELLACQSQIDELHRVTRYPKVQKLASAAKIGHMINDLKRVSIWIKQLPKDELSPDPSDDYLLALLQAGSADFLVTGDKLDLLVLGKHFATQIVTVRQFADQLGTRHKG